jgi:hypothetical protein
VGSAAPHRFCLYRESLGVLCALEVRIDGGKSAVAASLLPAQSKMLALMTREPNWSRHHHVIAFEYAFGENEFVRKSGG